MHAASRKWMRRVCRYVGTYIAAKEKPIGTAETYRLKFRREDKFLRMVEWVIKRRNVHAVAKASRVSAVPSDRGSADIRKVEGQVL